MSKIQAEIEARLAEVEPEVEVLLAEVVGGGLVRLFTRRVSRSIFASASPTIFPRCGSSMRSRSLHRARNAP
jgi:hypothetical protein